MSWKFGLNKSEEERAEELHRKSIIIDLHTHPVIIGPKRGALRWELRDLEKLYYEFCVGRSPTNYEGLKKSGITAYFDGFGTSRKVLPGFPMSNVPREWTSSLDQALWRLAEIHKHADSLVIAYKAEDVRKAKKEGKIAMFMMLESIIGNELDRVTYLYGLGVRMMGMTHSYSNALAGGCNEEKDGGLTSLGEDVVKKMNELGMIVDLSHCGKQTALDAIELSKDPCVFSHNACKSVYNSTKSKSDEEIHAIAEKGGIIAIETIPNTVASGPKQTIEDVLEHVGYAVDLAGIDHVGMGTDMLYGDHAALHRALAVYEKMAFSQIDAQKALKEMEKGTPYMYGIEDHDEWPNITRGLVSRGYSDQEIEKILGGNALKLMGRVLR